MLGSRFILLPLLCALGSAANACQICLPLPTESLADRILASEHLVLAREHPERPYTLEAIRTLKGSPADASPIDLLLDSSTRRLLALDPDRSVLCGWSPEQREWQRLVLFEEPEASVVREIIVRTGAWRKSPAERVRYFAGLLGHESTALSDLAHIEVSRAPYTQLLKFADRIPREELHARLGNLRRMEWHALYILFLAQSEDPRDHEFIRGELEDAARYGLSIQTAAWATALIEIDGMAGLQRVRKLYLEKPDRTRKEISAIHAALRVHGDEGKPELRDPIIALYGELLKTHPFIAAALVVDLTRWKRFDHVEKLTGLIGNAPLDLFAISRIRSHASAAASARGTAPFAPTAAHPP